MAEQPGLALGPGASPGSSVTVTLPEGMTYVSSSYGSCVDAVTVIPGTAPPPIQDVLIFDLAQVGTGTACSINVVASVDSIPSNGWEATADLVAQCAGDTYVASVGTLDTSVCGCDPNDKGVYPPGCDAEGFLEVPEPLDYRVRFQNLGLGPAENVVVTDRIDPDLDLESLRFTQTSHPYSSAQIDPNGMVVVRYDGIALPAAVDDPNGSQGGFVFRTEPLNTVDGTVYTNSADIFFDTNEVVVTNEVVNTIGVCPDYPVGWDPNGPSRSGVADGTNPGQGQGIDNNPTNGANSNPNQAP